MIDWKSKLTSRKFWVAVAGFVGGLIAFIKSPSGSAEAIGGLILQFGSVVSYIFGEGFADAAGAKAGVVALTKEDLQAITEGENVGKVQP